VGAGRLDAEKEARVSDRLVRRERLRDGPVEMQEHRVLVASESLGTYRALGRALLRQPAKAREDEAAALEEFGDEREREDPTQTEAARLRDAGEDELPADPAARGVRPHRERTHLREIQGQDRERAAPEKAGAVLGDDEIAKVLEEEIARPLEHPVLAGVPVDERLHVVDVLDARGPDGDAHSPSTSLASASASRTRSGAVPPGEILAASEACGRASSIALASKPRW